MLASKRALLRYAEGVLRFLQVGDKLTLTATPSADRTAVVTGITANVS